MKKLFKALSAAAAGFFAAAALTVTAFAEDYEFDVSSAAQSNGSWGQSFSYYTAQSAPENYQNFNPTWMTSDSEVNVEFTYEGETSAAPLELIWQTWEVEGLERDPDIAANWNKIAPYKFDDTSASFSYDDIVSVYGTDNFADVFAICVGDTGVKLTVTSMTITNCEIVEAEAPETEAAETEAEAEETTEKKEETTVEETTTAKKTEEVTTSINIAENEPKDEDALPIVLMIVLIVVVVAVIAVIVIMMIKKTKGRYY
ncbi:MAG: hypothetical protein IJ368_04220 [Oscillospiraceae bacterium]|nr:hypothetical protein [Oscillospiraceae bacterium]